MSATAYPSASKQQNSPSYNIGTVLWCTFGAMVFFTACAVGLVDLDRENDEINKSTDEKS